jgi:hypothetical protein
MSYHSCPHASKRDYIKPDGSVANDCGAVLMAPNRFREFWQDDAAQRWVARSHQGLAMPVQRVLDLPSKIGGNIIAGLLEPQLDHASRVLSITRNGGWINGNCGHCLECIDRTPPVIHYEAVPLVLPKRPRAFIYRVPAAASAPASPH